MDSIEKKLMTFYQQKKKEDEQAAPDFESFFAELTSPRMAARPYVAWRVAASVLLLSLAAFYFYRSANEPSKEIREIANSHFQHPLPSDILLKQSLHTEYIWKWKAPTDPLLKDANKLLKTDLNKKN